MKAPPLDFASASACQVAGRVPSIPSPKFGGDLAPHDGAQRIAAGRYGAARPETRTQNLGEGADARGDGVHLIDRRY